METAAPRPELLLLLLLSKLAPREGPRGSQRVTFGSQKGPKRVPFGDDFNLKSSRLRPKRPFLARFEPKLTQNGPQGILLGSFWGPFWTLLGAKRCLWGPFWSKRDLLGQKWVPNRSKNDPLEAQKLILGPKRSRMRSQNAISGPKSVQNESLKEVIGPRMRVLG